MNNIPPRKGKRITGKTLIQLELMTLIPNEQFDFFSSVDSRCMFHLKCLDILKEKFNLHRFTEMSELKIFSSGYLGVCAELYTKVVLTNELQRRIALDFLNVQDRSNISQNQCFEKIILQKAKGKFWFSEKKTESFLAKELKEEKVEEEEVEEEEEKEVEEDDDEEEEKKKTC
jgi:hypothetical protein